MVAWCPRGLLRVPARVAAAPVLAARSGVVVITGRAFPRIVVSFWLHVSFACHQCESSETTDVYYILIGAFFIKHILLISPPTLQRLILSATEISCVRNNRFYIVQIMYRVHTVHQ